MQADRPPEQRSWFSGFAELVKARTLTGFCLVTVKGVEPPIVGATLSELTAQGLSSPALQQFIRPFHSAGDNPLTFELPDPAGGSTPRKLLLFHQTPSSLYCLSRGRDVGVGAAQLPTGTLLVTFNRSALPAVAVAETERCCQALRR